MKQKLIMALFLSAVLVLTLSGAEIAFADYEQEYEQEYDDDRYHDSESERESECDDDKYEKDGRS